MLDLDRLDILEFLTDTIYIHSREYIVLIIDISIDTDLESGILSTGGPFFYPLHLIIPGNRAVYIFPPGVIRSSGVIPFINIYGVGAKRFNFILDVPLKAIDHGQDPDNTKDANSDAEQGKKGPQLIFP